MTFDNPIRQPWDGIVAHAAVYVRNEGKDPNGKARFLVLGVNCAHLGCPVSWFPESALFMCPCHGGVYYSDGSRASGPPPRGLFRCPWRVRKAKLEIQTPPLSDPIRHLGGTGLIGRQPVKETEMPFWRRRAEWIDRRLALRESLMPILRHPIPRSVDGPMGWWYVFGSASMTLLGIQVLTGSASLWFMCHRRTKRTTAWFT